MSSLFQIRFRTVALALLACLWCGLETGLAPSLRQACAWAQTVALVEPRLQTRLVVEGHLKSFSDLNSEREGLVRKWFVEAGCGDVSEQAVGRKLPPNVICVLPGETREAIVVGAHTDKVDRVGDGVVDNWAGAVLLPALVYSLGVPAHRHTFIFVGFSGEEKGLVGSRFYVEHLSRDQRGRIEGMVNFDSLGLGPTEVWAAHSDKVLLDALAAKFSVRTMNVEGASADSESFARYGIPRITLHSVTPETWAVLHSSRDTLAAIKMDDYYGSYRLVAEYLNYLDGAIKRDAR